jgi:hypothetical protein
MIVGEKQRDITAESIRKKITDYDIFRKLLGIDFKINIPFCNELRGERSESAIIREIDGHLVMKDYGDKRYCGSPFYVWGNHYGMNYNDALKDIERSFLLNEKRAVQQSVITWKQPTRSVSTPPLIDFTYRKPTKAELSYWDAYYIGLEDLKKDNVYFPREIWRNKSLLPSSSDLTFIYYYPEVDKVKLYRPFGLSGRHIPPHLRKWDASLPNTYMENLPEMANSDAIILTKSKKDRLTLMNVLETTKVCSIQSETISCIDDESMDFIQQNSRLRIAAIDNDKTGKACSFALTEGFGFKHINVPDGLTKKNGKPITDFSDWIKETSSRTVRHHFDIKYPDLKQRL